MQFKRSTKTLLAAAIALQGSLANALGLGDISLHSALDQPLDAEIRLRGLGDLDASQIRVRLADGSDFERAGVERLYALTEIRFAVDVTPGGDGRIRLSTERPVREPYLDFVVELRWPTGRALREYTVLLDLPTTAPAPSPVARAPVRSIPDYSAGSERASTGGGTWTGGDSYSVQSGDTLWRIASRTRPAGMSVQQMLVALHRDNPEAFINGNMNLLRAGAILRVPSAASVSQSEALGEVASQDRDWRSGGDGAASTVGSDRGDDASGSSASGAERAYLELASGDSGSAGTGGGGVDGGSGSAPLDEQLATVQENLSAKERENAELQSRLADLEEQVKNYEKVIELKGDSAADAQQAAATASAAPEAVAPAAKAAEPKPAAPAPVPERGLVERLMDSSVALGSAIGVLFLGALAFLFLRKRKEELSYSDVPESAALKRAAAARQSPVVPDRGEAEDDETDGTPPAQAAAPTRIEPVQMAAAVVPVAASAPVPEHRDPISEADILLAYGRTERAADVLRSALSEDPARSDVRLKLLAMQIDSGDDAGLASNIDALYEQGDARAIASAEAMMRNAGRSDLLAGGGEAETAEYDLADEPADDAVALAVEEPDFAAMEVDGDIAHLDAELTLDEEADAESVDAELELELGELDFGQDLDATPAADAPIAVAESVGDLDLELGGLDEIVTEAAAFEDVASGELEIGDPDMAEPDIVLSEPELATDDALGADDAADLGLLDGSDEVETKLELARAYLDMGDTEGARDILDEVVAEGSESQREQARALLERTQSD